LGDLSNISSQKLETFASSARAALDLPKAGGLTVEQVRSFAVFEDCTNEDLLKEIGSKFVKRAFGPGDIICLDATESEHIYFIDGSASLEVGGAEVGALSGEK
jgi:hypothetical protein